MTGVNAVLRVRAVAVVAFVLFALAAFSFPLDHADFVGSAGGPPATQSATEGLSKASDHAMTTSIDDLGNATGACGLLLLCAGWLFSLIRRPRHAGREVLQRRWCPEPLVRTGSVHVAFEPLHRTVVRRC